MLQQYKRQTDKYERIVINMTGTVFDIKRFAVHDGDGIRTTVFLKGCPLRCKWCHNPEGLSAKSELSYYADKCLLCGECTSVCPNNAHKIAGNLHTFDRTSCHSCGECEKFCPSGALKMYGKKMSADELLPILLEDKSFYDTSGGGVTLSGGECLIQADFCAEILALLKGNGIHTAVDTCGYVSREELDKVIPYTDTFLYDIKAYDDDCHIKCTGQSNKIILKNLQYISSRKIPTEIRYPFVPGYNSEQAEKIAAFLTKFDNITKIRILPYHNFAGSKYAALAKENTLPSDLPSDEDISKAVKIFKNYNLNAVS